MPKLKKRADGRYQSKVITGRGDDGKAIYKFIYGTSPADVEEKKKKLLEKVSRSSYIDGDKTTLTKWLDEWLQHIVNDSIRQNTWESYETVVRVHLVPGLGENMLSQIQPQAIRTFYDQKKKDGYSDRYVNYMHTILNSALSQAVEDDIILKNPCAISKKKTKRVKKKKEIHIFTQEQINALLKFPAEEWLHLLMFLAWGTGFRREELLGLRWKDIDIKKGMISVNQVVVYTQEFGAVIDTPKNESSFRAIPFPLEIAKELKSYHVRQNEQRLSKGIAYQNKGLVFCNDDGTQLDPRRVGKQVKRCIIKAGCPSILSLHCLRHTHATQLLKLGIHSKIVQYRLGHSSYQQTMDTYSHVIPQMQDNIADQLSGLLASPTTEIKSQETPDPVVKIDTSLEQK